MDPRDDAEVKTLQESLVKLREDKIQEGTYRPLNLLDNTIARIMAAESKEELALYAVTVDYVLNSMRLQNPIMRLATELTDELQKKSDDRNLSLIEEKVNHFLSELKKNTDGMTAEENVKAIKALDEFKQTIQAAKRYSDSPHPDATEHKQALDEHIANIQLAATKMSHAIPTPESRYNARLDTCENQFKAVHEKRLAAITGVSSSEFSSKVDTAVEVIRHAAGALPAPAAAPVKLLIAVKDLADMAKKVKPDQSHLPFWKRAWIGFQNTVGETVEAVKNFAKKHPVLTAVGAAVATGAIVAACIVFPPTTLVVIATAVGGGLTMKQALDTRAQTVATHSRITQRTSLHTDEFDQLLSHNQERRALASQERDRKHGDSKDKAATPTGAKKHEKATAPSTSKKHEKAAAATKAKAPTEHVSTTAMFQGLNINESHFAAPAAEAAASSTPSRRTSVALTEEEKRAIELADLAKLHEERLRLLADTQSSDNESRPAPPSFRRSG